MIQAFDKNNGAVVAPFVRRDDQGRTLRAAWVDALKKGLYVQREANYFKDADGQPAARLTVPEQFLTTEGLATPIVEVASALPAPLTPNEAAAPEAAAPAPAPAGNAPAANGMLQQPPVAMMVQQPTSAPGAMAVHTDPSLLAAVLGSLRLPVVLHDPTRGSTLKTRSSQRKGNGRLFSALFRLEKDVFRSLV